MATIVYLGKTYDVPASLTVLKALEQVGYRFVRGCGCRGGVCGACAFVYRLPDDPHLRGGLACQTTVIDGMRIATLPYTPTVRRSFDLEALDQAQQAVLTVYPEVLRCLGCGQCTRICPKKLDVRDLIAHIKRGDLAPAAAHSMECVMCNLCAARCPVAIPQAEVMLLVRRLRGRHGVAPAPDVEERVAEVEAGRYVNEIRELLALDGSELKARLAKA